MSERSIQMQTENLHKKDLDEADAAAFEAARFLRFAKEISALTHTPTIVIGNVRYGHHFVTSPLAQELEAAGCITTRFRVPSSTTNRTTMPSALTDKLTPIMANGQPDIIIVDGAVTNANRDMLRLPRAMIAYLNWIYAFNEATGKGDVESSLHKALLKDEPHFEAEVAKIRRYNPQQPYSISAWGDRQTSLISFGSIFNLPFKKPIKTEGPRFIFANPMVTNEVVLPDELSKHTVGYFDDPERNRNGHRINSPLDKDSLPHSKKLELNEYIRAARIQITSSVPNWTAKV